MEVGVVGASGYGGAELLRLLAGHPSLKVRAVAAGQRAGRDLAEVVPHLGQHGTLLPAEPEALEGCAVVFLATPHETSMALAPALLEQGATVLDLSAAFRLPAATFTAWYGLDHDAAALTPAVYGLPELGRGELPGARLVAVPGCYPTAALLALAPLAELTEADGVVITGMSGTSGAGSGLRDDLHASHAIANVAPYGAPSHRHTPEIEAGWAAARGGGPAALSFTPHLIPASRGLLATVSAPLRSDLAAAGDAARAAVAEAYTAAYAAEPFVAVRDGGAWPATTHVVGGNRADVAAAVDARTGRVTTACAIDNLVKGAAGQAIQAANVVLGLPETAGLPVAGVYP